MASAASKGDMPGLSSPGLAPVDSLNLSDSIGVFHGQDTPFVDSLSLSDSAAFTLFTVVSALTVSVADQLTFVDFPSFGGIKGTTVGDTLSLSDSVEVVLHTSSLSYLRRYLNDVQPTS